MRSNHRATDMVALEGVPPPHIPAKFQYGPLDMASLVKEEVSNSRVINVWYLKVMTLYLIQSLVW